MSQSKIVYIKKKCMQVHVCVCGGQNTYTFWRRIHHFHQFFLRYLWPQKGLGIVKGPQTSLSNYLNNYLSNSLSNYLNKTSLGVSRHTQSDPRTVFQEDSENCYVLDQIHFQHGYSYGRFGKNYKEKDFLETLDKNLITVFPLQIRKWRIHL